MMASVVATYFGRGRSGGVREGHLVKDLPFLHKTDNIYSHVVICAFSVGADVESGPPGHKLLHVQSDGTDVGAGLLEGVGASGGVKVAIWVAGALDVCRVLRNSATTV